MKNIVTACAMALAVVLPFGAIAGPYADFENQLRDAYGHYRAAHFQSNSGNAEATSKAIEALSGKWAALESSWGTTPPPQYADDPAYTKTLSAVSAVISQARQEVAAGDLPTAHLTLEVLRDELGSMHDRNGVVSFSDRMNAYHAKMEEVLEHDLAALPDGGVGMLREDAAVLAYLAENIVRHPAPESADPAYAALVEAMMQSVEALQAATRAGDAAAAKAAVGGLKVPYSKLFAKFG